MNEKEWKTACDEAMNEYQNDLVKYTNEIKLLKKSNWGKQKIINKQQKLLESIYPFMINVKDKINKIENKFNERG